MRTLSELRQAIEPARLRLLDHPIYQRIDSVERLQVFMEGHVFAVWDFMSLAKRLQRDLTSIELPWVPAESAASARFINEVVLSEESDLGPDGEPRSHLELYREAMLEVGADPTVFDRFLGAVSNGTEWEAALSDPAIPPEVRGFVTTTLRCARDRSTVEVASAFLFGREDLIPEMFERLLGSVSRPDGVSRFRYYLDRHIELDGDEHGPIAEKLLCGLLEKDGASRELAVASAREALEARCTLWDGILQRCRTAETGCA